MNGHTDEGYRPLLGQEKIRIAFLFQGASFWPAWDCFYFSCVNDERYEVKLFLLRDDIYTTTADHAKYAQSFLEGIGIVYEVYTDAGFDDFSPHMALLQTPYDYLQRTPRLYSIRLKNKGIRVVYIPYGIELADTKAARYDHFRQPVLQNAWRVYTLSEAFKREYDKYCGNANAVRALGFPRFDALLQKERFALPEPLRTKINGRKIIVWHAHFAKVIYVAGQRRQVTPYLEEYIAFAEKLSLYSNEFFFVFLPHPHFLSDDVDSENHLKSSKLLETINLADNAYVDNANDYRPSLLTADAIITDRSALMIESAIPCVPVLFLHNPDYNEPIFPPLVPLIDSYYQGCSCADMFQFIHSLSLGQDKKKPLREAMLRQCVPCLDGKCSERIKEDLFHALNEITPTCEAKPCRIILFGLGHYYDKIMSTFSFPKHHRIVAVSDNNGAKWGRQYGGVTVIPPHEIINTSFDKIIIMVGNLFEEQIYQQLRFDLEIPDNKIVTCGYLTELL